MFLIKKKCIATEAQDKCLFYIDGSLIFTELLKGGTSQNIPSVFFVFDLCLFYANKSHGMVSQGEKEELQE